MRKRKGPISNDYLESQTQLDDDDDVEMKDREEPRSEEPDREQEEHTQSGEDETESEEEEKFDHAAFMAQRQMREAQASMQNLAAFLDNSNGRGSSAQESFPKFQPLNELDQESDESEDSDIDRPEQQQSDESLSSRALEALSVLTTTWCKQMSRQIAGSQACQGSQASHRYQGFPRHQRLNDFSRPIVTDEVSRWLDSLRQQQDFIRLSGPRSLVSLFLQLYCDKAAAMENTNSLMAFGLSRSPDCGFEVMEQLGTLTGMFGFSRFSDEHDDLLVTELANKLADANASLICVANCSIEELLFLKKLWVYCQNTTNPLRQLIVGAVVSSADEAKDLEAQGISVISCPTAFSPLWPHGPSDVESLEARALMSLVAADSRVLEMRNLVTCLDLSDEHSLWSFPCLLTFKQRKAMLDSTDMLARRYLYLYRETGDVLSLLTLVLPDRDSAQRVNDFYSRRGAGKPMFFSCSVDPVPSEVQVLVNTRFFVGLRVILLVPVVGQRRGSLGVVFAVDQAKSEVKVWFDATQLIVVVPLVQVRLQTASRDCYDLTFVPLQTAFAITPSLFLWGQFGEIIACGLNEEQRRDVIIALLSVTSFYWTDDLFPRESESMLIPDSSDLGSDSLTCSQD
jgi:hypothetical protein